MKLYSFLILLLFSINILASEPSRNLNSSASNYIITGKVIEQVSGETLTGVEIEILGTDISVYSDFDGEFEIKGLNPSNVYTLKINYVSYKKQVLRGISTGKGEMIIKLENEKKSEKSVNTTLNPVS